MGLFSTHDEREIDYLNGISIGDNTIISNTNSRDGSITIKDINRNQYGKCVVDYDVLVKYLNIIREIDFGEQSVFMRVPDRLENIDFNGMFFTDHKRLLNKTGVAIQFGSGESPQHSYNNLNINTSGRYVFFKNAKTLKNCSIVCDLLSITNNKETNFKKCAIVCKEFKQNCLYNAQEIIYNVCEHPDFTTKKIWDSYGTLDLLEILGLPDMKSITQIHLTSEILQVDFILGNKKKQYSQDLIEIPFETQNMNSGKVWRILINYRGNFVKEPKKLLNMI